MKPERYGYEVKKDAWGEYWMDYEDVEKLIKTYETTIQNLRNKLEEACNEINELKSLALRMATKEQTTLKIQSVKKMVFEAPEEQGCIYDTVYCNGCNACGKDIEEYDNNVAEIRDCGGK